MGNTRGDGVPASITRAGVLVAAQGLAAVIVAAVLAIRALIGGHDSVADGYGTAAWFVILGGGVLAGGIALIRGQRWGRAPAVVAQVLLIPVAWALLTDSRQPIAGAGLAAVVLAALAFLLAPASSAWLAEDYAPEVSTSGDPGGPVQGG